MEIKEAQQDMRQAYYGGAPGVFVSGLVWLISGIMALSFSKEISLIVFFFSGMLIFPIGILLSKILSRSGKHKKENPLSNLPLESTFILFFGLFIAYSVFQIQEDWFYPIMLMIIGSRYLTFATIYGMKVYWVLGILLAITGVESLLLEVQFHLCAIIGGIIELIFSVVIFYLEKSKSKFA